MCSFRPGTGAFATVHPSPILSKGTWDCRRGNCRQARPPPCRAVPSRGKTADRHRFGNEDEPPMNTNRHQTDGPPSMTSAPECFCDFVLWVSRGHGMKPPGSAGVPPAQIFPQPRPSPPPGSTGNGARALLRPGRCGCRRQGGRLASQGDRAVKGRGCGRDARAPGGCRPDGAVGGIRQASSLKADRPPLENSRLPAGRAPSPYPGADHEGRVRSPACSHPSF